MKKLIAWSLALLCALGIVGCAETDPDAQGQAGDSGASDGEQSRFGRYTVTAAYDYGMHRPELATLLYDSSTAFFELPDGIEEAIAGDVFTVKYSGQLLIQESYPSSVVFQGGKVESVEMNKAKLARLTYYAPDEGEDERFVILHDNGVEEEIEVAKRPDYFITDVEGQFEALSDVSYSTTLFGSYSPVDGYNEEAGYSFLGLYAWNPRYEPREVHPDTLAALNELNENADFAFDLLAKEDECDFTGYTHEPGIGSDAYEKDGQSFWLSAYPDYDGGDYCITSITCRDGTSVFGLDGSEDEETIKATLEAKGYALSEVGTSLVAKKYGVSISFGVDADGLTQIRVGVQPTNDTGIVY